MKNISNSFKEQIKEFGRELDSIISYELNGEVIELRNENLNSVTPNYQSSILKSVMKELDIDSNVDIPIGTVLNYKFGVLIDDEYEYINYGNYVVYSSEKQEDTNSYNIVCFDKMLFSMIEYKKLQSAEVLGRTFPMTVKNYIDCVATDLGLLFKNKNENFVNSNRMIQGDLYAELGYTYRDILDELAQVTASNIVINEEDQLEIRYITDTYDTIDEEYLKDVNVAFGEKYGPINSIVLSRAAESDNVYLTNEESVEENGLCELKIVENQIMNFNDRSDYLPEILEKLNGLEYYINDFSSVGICYYDVCDRYNVKIGEETYSCVMFNDQVNITQGLEEFVHTDLPEQAETDYTKADKTDRRINQTYLIVDKQNQKIESIASKVVDISKTISGNGQIKLENALEGKLHKLSIKGNISLFYPQKEELLYGYPLVPHEGLVPKEGLVPSYGVPYNSKLKYPSQNLFSKSNILLIDDKEYKLDFDYLNYINNQKADEYVCEEGKCYVIRRVGVKEDGSLYALDKEIIINKKDLILEVKKDSIIKMKSFDNTILSAEYLTENQYTDVFATQAEVSTSFTQTTDKIELLAKTKVGENEIISKINQSPEEISIDASKISLQGKEINLTGEDVSIKGDHLDINSDGRITLYDTENEFFNSLFSIQKSEDKRMYINSNGIEFRHDIMESGFSISALSFAVNGGRDGYGIMSTDYLSLSNKDIGEDRLLVSLNAFQDGLNYFSNPVYIETDLTVGGSKNRVVKTESYGKRLLNAYETATPYFGDIGSDITDEDGYCRIDIDNIFKEVIELENYKVFIQKCGNGDLYVIKHNDYFEVIGTPNLEFDWEIKAIQKGYSDNRLEKFIEKKDIFSIKENNDIINKESDK